MAEMLALAPRRVITPIAAALIAVALAAALLLGFGLRAWTEDTSQPAAPVSHVHSSPAHVVQPAGSPPTEALRKNGRPY